MKIKWWIVTVAVIPCVSAAAVRGAGNVTGFETVARPNHFTGACPTTIKFTAVIHVDAVPTTVEYQWERSDGATGPKRKLTLKNKGVGVNDTWQLGGAGQTYHVWEKVHVLSPNDMSSGEAPATVTCKP